MCLHNYPQSLQHITRPDGEVIDLAAIDVLRNRERGVPRYNEFRRLLHMKAPKTFEELTTNPVWAQELREVYDGDIEKVDLLVGSYAEPLPKGFAFSDTAFRIFVLMASRRLRSDRSRFRASSYVIFPNYLRPLRASGTLLVRGTAWPAKRGHGGLRSNDPPDQTGLDDVFHRPLSLAEHDRCACWPGARTTANKMVPR